MARDFFLFERGKEFERGLRPLYPALLSPAMDDWGLCPMYQAGEGIKGRG
jgi:hypothetical protein